MNTSLVAVGRLKQPHTRALCEDYVRRVRRFGGIEVVEVRDARGVAASRAVDVEAERIVSKLPSTCLAVALDEGGRRLSSVDFARWIEARSRDAVRDLRFVVGGAHGLGDAVRKRCSESIRLSDMTLPHELARLLFLEQYYRAWTILRREPYHHA